MESYLEMWGGPHDGRIVGPIAGYFGEYRFVKPHVPAGGWFSGSTDLEYQPVEIYVYGNPKRNPDRNPGHVRLEYLGVRNH